MQKIVVIGAEGMLGQELVRAFSSDSQYVVTAWDRKDVDATDFVLLAEKLAELSPNIVLNVVAYNAVDLCEEDETEYQKAVLLNVTLPKELARLSTELDFTLVHYSTDYVFDGTLEASAEKKCAGACCGGNCHGSSEGYDESALPNPVSKYGTTKYMGEQAVAIGTETQYTIRLSKLFGKPAVSAAGKRSFFEVMLELGKTKEEISAVDGEMSCFTYAPDLAKATKELLESDDEFGTYHFVNEGAVTWYEGVQELYRQAGITIPVKPVGPDAFPRPAKRPAFSVLMNTKRPKLRHYSEALADFLKERSA
jgi:dTDP-4-dehydrorhamnose reductase